MYLYKLSTANGLVPFKKTENILLLDSKVYTSGGLSILTVRWTDLSVEENMILVTM